MSNRHGAAGQASGYVYQIQIGLLELLREIPKGNQAKLSLEATDDVELLSSKSIERIQVKHSSSSGAVLDTNSVDIWRTINSWLDMPDWKDVMLRFVTNRRLKKGSLLENLRFNSKGPIDEVLSDFEAVAGKQTNKKTSPWKRKFLSLPQEERRDLISKITIYDEAASMDQFESELEKALFFIGYGGRRSAVIQELRGWWSKKVEGLLNRDFHYVTADELSREIFRLQDQLVVTELPISNAVRNQDCTTNSLAEFEEAIFVRQLKLSDISSRRIEKAVTDYLKSKAQRTEWLRGQFLSESDIDQFEDDLYDFWEEIYLCEQEETEQLEEHDSNAGFARKVYNTVMREGIKPIKGQNVTDWVSRGTYHVMANDESSRRIGWHPNFDNLFFSDRPEERSVDK